MYGQMKALSRLHGKQSRSNVCLSPISNTLSYEVLSTQFVSVNAVLLIDIVPARDFGEHLRLF